MTDTARDDVATITLSEHSRLLIASHRAMRADGRRLITATHRLQDRRPSDALALGRAFAEIVTLIDDHHWSEDDVLYPFLATRLPHFNHDAVQLEQDHVNLDAAMARVTAGLPSPRPDRHTDDPIRHPATPARRCPRLQRHPDRSSRPGRSDHRPRLRVDDLNLRAANPRSRRIQARHLPAHPHGRAMGPREHHTRRSDRTPTDRPPTRRRDLRPPLEATVPTCHGPALPTGPTAPTTPTSGRHDRVALQHTLEHAAERGRGNVIRTKNGRLVRSPLLVTSRNRTARWPRTPAR